MDKLHNKKSKGNSKKDIFYLLLFVCLCVVATTAGILSMKNKNVKPNVAKAPTTQSQPVAKNVDETKDKKETKIENANLVKKKQNEINKNSVAANTKPAKVSFSKPLEGKVVTNYTGSKNVAKTEEGARSILGIYVASEKPNAKVLASADGVVVFAGMEDEYGEKVILDHGNGYRTIYSNLSEKDLPKVNSKVKKGEAIGSVGTTAKNIYDVPNLLDNKTALYFQIEKLTKESDGKKNYIDVNPNDYIKYESKEDTKKDK